MFIEHVKFSEESSRKQVPDFVTRHDHLVTGLRPQKHAITSALTNKYHAIEPNSMGHAHIYHISLQYPQSYSHGEIKIFHHLTAMKVSPTWSDLTWWNCPGPCHQSWPWSFPASLPSVPWPPHPDQHICYRNITSRENSLVVWTLGIYMSLCTYIRSIYTWCHISHICLLTVYIYIYHIQIPYDIYINAHWSESNIFQQAMADSLFNLSGPTVMHRYSILQNDDKKWLIIRK